MAKLIEPLLDWASRHYAAAVEKSLRKYGLRYDDLLDPLQDPDTAEALRRIPKEEYDMRQQRLKRAMDASLKHTPLPRELQVRRHGVAKRVANRANACHSRLLAVVVGRRSKRHSFRTFRSPLSRSRRSAGRRSSSGVISRTSAPSPDAHPSFPAPSHFAPLLLIPLPPCHHCQPLSLLSFQEMGPFRPPRSSFESHPLPVNQAGTTHRIIAPCIAEIFASIMCSSRLCTYSLRGLSGRYASLPLSHFPSSRQRS